MQQLSNRRRERIPASVRAQQYLYWDEFQQTYKMYTFWHNTNYTRWDHFAITEEEAEWFYQLGIRFVCGPEKQETVEFYKVKKS